MLLKPKAEQRDPLTLLINLVLGWFFKLFNAGFNVTTTIYTSLVGALLRLSLVRAAAPNTYGGSGRTPLPERADCDQAHPPLTREARVAALAPSRSSSCTSTAAHRTSTDRKSVV